MSEILRLTLLGSPRVLIGEQPLTSLTTHKAQALLFYLAVTACTDSTRHPEAHPKPHSRDAIATLLWGEMTDARAKQNLRTVLPELRTSLGGDIADRP